MNYIHGTKYSHELYITAISTVMNYIHGTKYSQELHTAISTVMNYTQQQ